MNENTSGSGGIEPPHRHPPSRRSVVAGAAGAVAGAALGVFGSLPARAAPPPRTLTPAEAAGLAIASRPVAPVTSGPGHPLVGFYRARDQVGTRRVVIETLGNSHTEGQLGKSVAGGGWVSQLAQLLRAEFPTSAAGSPGYVPSRYQVTDAQVVDARWVYSGSVVRGTQHGLGRRSVPMAGAGTARLIAPSGAPLVFDRVMIAWFATAPGDAITVTVGSDDPVTVTADSAGPKSWSSPAYGRRSARAVSLIRSAGSPELEGAWPFDQDAAKGIHVLNGGQSGAIAASFSVGSGVAGASSSWADSTIRYDPALRIRSFMTNDPNVQTAGEFQRSLQAIVTLDRMFSPCPILLLGEFERAAMPGGRVWKDYVAAARSVAAANPAVAFLDLGEYIPKLAGLGGYDPFHWLSADGVHLTLAGDARAAAAIAPLLSARPAP